MEATTKLGQTTVTAAPTPFDPFVSTDTYRADIYRPMKRPGDPVDDVVGWVELRPLNAGDRAEFNELKIASDGDAGIDVGLIQLLMVDRALVSWSFERTKSVETIRVLDPDVFDQIWGHVSMGNPTLADAVDDLKADGEPDPTAPAPEPAATAAAGSGENA